MLFKKHLTPRGCPRKRITPVLATRGVCPPGAVENTFQELELDNVGAESTNNPPNIPYTMTHNCAPVASRTGIVLGSRTYVIEFDLVKPERPNEAAA